MQYNINVANGTGMEVRTNLNLAHQSLATNFFGATDPSLMSPVCAFPGSTWADTGNGLLKVRNADDSDWIVIGTIESDGTPKITSNGFTVNASDVVNTPSGTISATNVQDAINELASESGLNLRKPSTAYSVGDIAYSALLPSWAYIECIVGGTTDSGDLPVPSSVVANATFADGTVTWKIQKIGSGSGRNVGDIFLHAGNGENPQGALLCDGSAVSRTMYPDLFEKIGTTYGAGDGSTTFNLPNLSDNRFVEGSTTAGVSKSAGLPNIKGQFTSASNVCSQVNHTAIVSGPFTANNPTLASDNFALDYISSHGGNDIGFDASLSNPIYGNSDTVQPKSLTLRYFIQAFDGQTPNSALIDITQYAQELATKANRQLSNLDTANLACHVVVDSYYDSTTGDWWRKYDDGWVEQGGEVATVDNQTVTVNLLKAMMNDKYTVLTSRRNPNSGAYLPCLKTRTTTTITILGYYDYSIWYVAGMGASV